MREFTVGGVLSRLLALLRAQGLLLLGLAILFCFVPNIVLFIGLQRALMQHTSSTIQLLGFGMTAIVWTGIILLDAAVVRVAVETVHARTPLIGDVLATAARYFFPVLAIALITSLVAGLASFLFLFPALMVLCRWLVAVPVEVAERSGIIAAFSRSAALTKGVRWRLFGALLVVAVLAFALYFLLVFVGSFVGQEIHATWPDVIVMNGAQALFLLVLSLFRTAAYIELREIREGALSENLVSVFD